MRGSPFAAAIAAVVLTLGCSRSEARSVDDVSATSNGIEAVSAAVSDTVRAGETFELAWPDPKAARACVRIPADAVATGTEVSIALLSESTNPAEYPRRFRKAAEEGRAVYPPVVRISADPGFRIEEPENHLTVGICAISPPGVPFAGARIAHNDPDDPDALEELPVAAPCALVCERSPTHYGEERDALAPLDWLLGGTPFRPDPLLADGAALGLGGKSGSLSPFAAVSGE